jgi:hypothetical protein
MGVNTYGCTLLLTHTLIIQNTHKILIGLHCIYGTDNNKVYTDRVRQIQRGLRKSKLKRRTSILRQRLQGLGRGVYACMSKLVNGFKNNYPLKQII